MTEQSSTHTLYRFFDKSRTLLYVGRTISPSKRWSTHERKAPWYSEVASVTREVFPSAEAVAEAERNAIASERPLHNIALNPNRPARQTPRKRPDGDYPDSLVARWASLYPDSDVIEAILDCLGEPMDCECPDCHDTRLCELEDLRSKYDWHPDFEAEIEVVEALYYGGKFDLYDWYYDLYDVEMFARMRLVTETKVRPIPAYAVLSEATATVECPFCFRDHRHFLTSGAVLDRPLEAGCQQMTGGLYVLMDDWAMVRDQQIAWGEVSARSRAA